MCKSPQPDKTAAVVSPDEAEDVACEGSIGEAVVGGYGLGVIGGRRRSRAPGGGGSLKSKGGTMGGVRKGSR